MSETDSNDVNSLSLVGLNEKIFGCQIMGNCIGLGMLYEETHLYLSNVANLKNHRWFEMFVYKNKIKIMGQVYFTNFPLFVLRENC